LNKRLMLRLWAFMLVLIIAFPQLSYAAVNNVVPTNAVVLYIGSNKAYVNKLERFIDDSDKSITPVVQANRTLVPIRFVAESMGAVVDWNQENKTITIKYGSDTITMQLGSKDMYKNGVKFTSEVAPFVKNSRTLVPLRVISESLGKNVFYDRNVVLISDNTQKFNATVDKPIIDNIIQNYVTGQKLSVEQISTMDKSVVVVYNLDNTGKYVSQGSGFYIGGGIIVTNFHVIENANRVIIETEENVKYDVEGIIASDANTDLAMLKLKSDPKLPAMQLGFDLSLIKGQSIVTIGTPQELKNTVSTGIVSGLRKLAGIDLIQISAPITNGSSGGPLIDMYGRVIGINSAGIDNGNLNFAVSINHLKDWYSRFSGVSFENLRNIGKENYPKDSNLSDTEILEVLNKVSSSFNNKKVNDYINNFYYTSEAVKDAEEQLLTDLFKQFDIEMKIQNRRIIKKTANETLVRAETSYKDKLGPYGSEEVQAESNLFYLKKYGTQWKIYRVDTEYFVNEGKPYTPSNEGLNSNGGGVFEPDNTAKTGTIKEIDVQMAIDSFKYNQSNNKIYALNKANKKLIIIDAADKSIEKTVKLNNRPSEIAISKDNSKAYITNDDSNTITEVSLWDNTITREIPWNTASARADNRHFHIEFYDNKLYLIDAQWTPALWILDLNTMKITDYGQNSNSSNMAKDKIDNVGDFVIDEQTGDIYFWQQYGWDAGWAASDLHKYEKTANGYQLVESAGFGYDTFKRDPLDAPIMLVKDKNWVITKKVIANMYNLKQKIYTFDEEVYAVHPQGLYAVSKKNVYDLKKFDKIGTVPLQNADAYFFDSSGVLYMVNNKTSKILYSTLE